MHKEKIVLVGNGMAGIRCVEEIIKRSPDRFAITIFGSEPHENYNRILLSSVLQGEASFEDLTTHNSEWYRKNNIQLFVNETVTCIDGHNKTIMTNKGRHISYDKLILATGSIPFLLPLPGNDLEGIMTFRTIEDCEKIIESSKWCKKAVVIGGGVLGLEAARGLLHLGLEVHVVHLSPFIMDRQLDSVAARLLQKELEKQGMRFLLEKETSKFTGNNRVEKVMFKDGAVVDTDLVVMAAGVRPNITLAKECGIQINHGIVVNDYLETNKKDIYALGECAEHNGVVYGLVKPLYEQGRILARRICGQNSERYKAAALSTKLKISGVDVFSAGQLEVRDGKILTAYDESERIYKKLVFQGKTIMGAVLYGDTRESTRILEWIQKKKELTDKEKLLLLECENQDLSMTNLPQNSLVCNCNGVTKRTIIESVRKGGLSTVEEIKKCTKASSSCGGCKPLITELLAYIKSDQFSEMIVEQGMCSCTLLTEDEVVEQIQTHGLKSGGEIKGVLEWGSEEGCHRCRPALNYYLGMIYPESQEVNLDLESIQENTVRAVKAYAIPQDCHCSVKEHYRMANTIKDKIEFLTTPYRLTIGVYPCTHGSSRSMPEDVRVIKSPRGWEVYVGGNEGSNPTSKELLSIAASEVGVFEDVCGFVQYYRETAKYWEPTGKWIERLGLIHIREVLFDHEARKWLLKRLEKDAVMIRNRRDPMPAETTSI